MERVRHIPRPAKEMACRKAIGFHARFRKRTRDIVGDSVELLDTLGGAGGEGFLGISGGSSGIKDRLGAEKGLNQG